MRVVILFVRTGAGEQNVSCVAPRKKLSVDELASVIRINTAERVGHL